MCVCARAHAVRLSLSVASRARGARLCIVRRPWSRPRATDDVARLLASASRACPRARCRQWLAFTAVVRIVRPRETTTTRLSTLINSSGDPAERGTRGKNPHHHHHHRRNSRREGAEEGKKKKISRERGAIYNPESRGSESGVGGGRRRRRRERLSETT